ncbi:cytochrome B5-like protein [Sarcoptes scabiei]|uniref:Cytochrome b5 n=1 Tax=Sarcoptes scabiei TaxID=52283 RepID=A0A132AEW4_SARSC|nr:cytochrome B5-like protein [Sarcoptes scabiei]
MADSKTFTLEEVSEHNEKKSVWLVIHDSVYDVTPFLDEEDRAKTKKIKFRQAIIDEAIFLSFDVEFFIISTV